MILNIKQLLLHHLTSLMNPLRKSSDESEYGISHVTPQLTGPYACKWCPRSFPSRRGLNNHMRTHKKRTYVERPRVENNIKPVTPKVSQKSIECYLCSRSLPVDDLIVHMRTHHMEDIFSRRRLPSQPSTSTVITIKPTFTVYKCDECKYEFISKEVYDQHIKLHAQGLLF